MKRGASLIILIIVLSNFSFSQNRTSERNMEYYIDNAPFKMERVRLPNFPDKVFDITEYGAVADGQTLCTTAFSKAIEACSAVGGGKVVVTPGLYLTGPIKLESNINLEVQRGALIIFTTDHSQYPMIPSSKGSSNIVAASPIYGYDLNNIAITGEGIIDGAGESWRPVKKIKTTASQWKELTASGAISKDGSVWWPTKEAMDGEDYLKQLKEKNKKPAAEELIPARDFLRPYMLYLVNCRNILIQNVTIRNSPKFVFLPSNCNNLIMDHVNVFNEWYAQNGDGIDLSACKNAIIYMCNVSVGDDGICMKSSGNNPDRNIPALANIIIAKCNVYRAHGGFVIGSNTDGGVQNVYVADCNFVGTDIGIRIKSNAGRGGLVKQIFIDNIFMRDITNDAILFDTYYEDVPAGKERIVSKAIREKTPEFTQFFICNVYCNGAKNAITVTGLPEMPVNNLHLNNVTISSRNGVAITDAADLDFKNVKNLDLKSCVLKINASTLIRADNKTSGLKLDD